MKSNLSKNQSEIRYGEAFNLERAVETTKDTNDTKRELVTASSGFTRQVRFFGVGKTHSQPLVSCVSCSSWFISTAVIRFNQDLTDQAGGRRREEADGGVCHAIRLVTSAATGRRFLAKEWRQRNGETDLVSGCYFHCLHSFASIPLPIVWRDYCAEVGFLSRPFSAR